MGLHLGKVCEQFSVFRREGNDLRRRDGVITAAAENHRIRPTHLNFHLAKTAIKVRVCTAVRKGVTRADFRIDALQSSGDVICIFQEAAASVFGDAIQKVLLSIQSFLSRDIEDAFARASPAAMFYVGSA